MTLQRLLAHVRALDFLSDLIIVLVAVWAQETLSTGVGIVVVGSTIFLAETTVIYVVNTWTREFLYQKK